jgi:hypothetical protein
LAEISIPLSIQGAREDDAAARAIGMDVAGVLRYQISVLDREDRLEAGTSNPECFSILEALHGPQNLTTVQLVEETGLGRLTLQERIGDLVSAGLASKVPEADQVVITSGGHSVTELIVRAAGIAAQELARVE